MKFVMALIVAAMTWSQPASAALKIGEAAPAIKAQDINGKEVDLEALRGRHVILEWKNHQCPFVRKHYKTGNMQRLQAYAREKGAVWISIISSAEGKQGYVSPEEAADTVADEKSHAEHVVLDPSGEIGRLYDAKTTPHMYVIDTEGKLAYMGAIDDDSTADPEAVEGAKNYVTAALDALIAGTTPETQVTTPYGCSIKY